MKLLVPVALLTAPVAGSVFARQTAEESQSAEDSVYVQVDKFPSGIPTTAKMMQRVSRAIDGRACRGHPPLVAILYLSLKGEIEQVELKDSYESECEKSAVRALIQEARFTPGIKDGRPVKVKLSIPLRFSR